MSNHHHHDHSRELIPVRAEIPAPFGPRDVIPAPREAIETAFVAPEAVLLDDNDGRVYRLNPSASSVWLLVDGQHSAAEIAVDLSEFVPVPAERLVDDVVAAVSDFHSRGLLTPQSSVDDSPTVAPADDVRILRPPPDP